jgi:tryptophan synthase alpha chain
MSREQATAGSTDPIATVFARLRERGELALIPYLTAGFPSMESWAQDMRRVVEAGADLLEVGIPFSDPIADGPTIQHASHVALQAGTTLRGVLGVLERTMAGVPTVVMSYLNPLLALGEELFPALRAAGVAGLIVPDLPVDESAGWCEAADRQAVCLIHLAAPTSTEERLRRIAQRSRGFIYAVSLTGTTGARSELPAGLPDFLARIRAWTRTPVVVGFGISQPAQVRALRGRADGVVVGSRLVDAIRSGEDLAELVRNLKEATRG